MYALVAQRPAFVPSAQPLAIQLRPAPHFTRPQVAQLQLTRRDRRALERYRQRHNVERLAVHWDSYITDTVAWRHYDTRSYAAWQITRANGLGQPIGRDGNPLAPGDYMYVVTTGNEFRYLPKHRWPAGNFDQYRTHSQLSGGRQVYAAGGFTVNPAGFIASIDNESGHYRPPDATSVNYAKTLLRHLGVRVDPGGPRRYAPHTGTAVNTHVATPAERQWTPWLRHQLTANARAAYSWVQRDDGASAWLWGFPRPTRALAGLLPY